MPVIYKVGLKTAEVDTLQASLSKKLPLSYKSFLEKMNGFYLADPDFGELPFKAVDDGFITFDRFFGFLPDDEPNDLVSFNNEFIGELDYIGEAIAIADDGGGNPYVLICELDRDWVYYWDRTHLHELDLSKCWDVSEHNDSGNLYLVAQSFTDFYGFLMGNLDSNVKFISEG